MSATNAKAQADLNAIRAASQRTAGFYLNAQAVGALTAAEAKAAAATSALATAQARATVTTRALGVATGFLLGPWGLLIAAVGAGAMAFSASADSVDMLGDKFKDLEKDIESTLNVYERYIQRLGESRAADMATLSLEELNIAYDKAASKIEFYTMKLLRLEESNASLSQKMKIKEKLELEKIALDNITKSLSTAGTAYDKLTGAVKKVVNSYEEQLILLKMTDEEQEIYNALKKAGVGANSVFGKEVVKSVKALQDEKQQLKDIENIYSAVEDAVKSLNQAEKDKVTNGYKKDLKDIENIYSAVEEAAKSLEEENKAFAESLQSVIDKADPLGAKLREVAAEMEILKKGLATGAIDSAQFEKLSKGLANSLKDAGKDAGKEIPDELSQGMDTVSDALASALMSGDWDNVGEAIGGVLGSAVGDVVSNAVEQSVGGMAGAIAGPLAGAIAGAAVSIAIDEIGDFLKGDYIDPSEERQRTQGTGTVLGDISAKSESISRSNDLIADATDNIVNINRGMLRALQSLRGDLANVAGMTAGARGDFSFTGPEIDENLYESIFGGYNVAELVGFILGGDLLGGSSKKVDEGIRILGGNITDLVNDSVVQAFASFKSRKNIFDDYDVSNKFQNFEDDINDQFELAFASIIDSVFEGASAFGVSDAAINKAIQEFEIETTIISLKGLNTEEQQAEIEAVFSKIFDDLTLAVIPNLQEFQALGEGLGETLARVSTSVQLTSEAADSLGFSLGGFYDFTDGIYDPFEVYGMFGLLDGGATEATADMLAKAANELVDLAGGVEAFSQALASYEKNFLSAQENTENLSRRLGDAMGELPLPETRQGFADLMASQTSATAAGRENIAMLLQLQGVADQYYSCLLYTSPSPRDQRGSRMPSSA